MNPEYLGSYAGESFALATSIGLQIYYQVGLQIYYQAPDNWPGTGLDLTSLILIAVSWKPFLSAQPQLSTRASLLIKLI